MAGAVGVTRYKLSCAALALACFGCILAVAAGRGGGYRRALNRAERVVTPRPSAYVAAAGLPPAFDWRSVGGRNVSAPPSAPGCPRA